MATNDASLCVRLSLFEKQSFLATAAQLDTTPSKLLRTLCRLDVRLMQGLYDDYSNGQAPVLILVDDSDFAELAQQIRRFGQQYNQAVHALNSIALKNGWSYNAQRELLRPTIAILEDIQSHIEIIDAQARVIRNHHANRDYLLMEGGGR